MKLTDWEILYLHTLVEVVLPDPGTSAEAEQEADHPGDIERAGALASKLWAEKMRREDNRKKRP